MAEPKKERKRKSADEKIFEINEEVKKLEESIKKAQEKIKDLKLKKLYLLEKENKI